MAKEMETLKDEGLQGNETIEEAILGLQKEPTPELLAHVLTVIRRRMKEGGQAILSVEPPSGDDQIRIGTDQVTIALMREGKYDQILKRMENVLDLSKERRFCGKDGIWVGAE